MLKLALHSCPHFFLGIHTPPGSEDFILSAHYVYSILLIGTVCSVGWIQRLVRNIVKMIESRTIWSSGWAYRIRWILRIEVRWRLTKIITMSQTTPVAPAATVPGSPSGGPPPSPASTPSPFLGQAVIPLVNKLQDIFAQLGSASTIDLPQV